MMLIGIAGGSGSGKTTFTRKILKKANHPACGILHQDSYYRPTPPDKLKINGEPNFDHPDAFDWPLFKTHLMMLKEGKTIEQPVYDYHQSRRSAQTTPIGPCGAVLVEGIFTLWEEEIRDLFDLKVYLSVDADIRFIRRLHRDVRERTRSIDSIIRQYYDTVRPMHQLYLEPTKKYADLVVGEETDLAADVIGAKVSETIRALGV